MSKRFFVYILANQQRGVLYVGSTGDIVRPLTEHKNKLVPGFASRYGVVKLMHLEEYPTIIEARAREAAIKRWRRAWKFDLIEKLNPDWNDLTDQIQL
jgi:putative endonuclease